MRFIITSFFILFLLVFAGSAFPDTSFASSHTGQSGYDSGTGQSGYDSGTGQSGYDSGTGQNLSGGSAVLTNPLSNISSIPDFFRVLIEIILVFAIPFIVFFIIYAGFLYVTAQGNAEKISQAHRALLYALIGGMLILGANVLLDIITNTVEQIK